MLRQDEVDVEVVAQRFGELVNMGASLLDQWLDSDEAHDDEDPTPADAAAEHAPGRRVVDVLRTPPERLGPVDHAFMRRAVVQIERLLSQPPDDPDDERRWRCELMRWGHDPSAS